MTKTRVVSVTLLSLVANIALAASDNSQGQNNQEQNKRQQHERREHEPRKHDPRAVSAPEIDPGQAMGALVLLGGAVAICRGYRRKR